MKRPWGKQQLKCRLGHTLWVPGTLGRSLGFAPSVPRPAPAVTHTPRVEDGLYERARWEQRDSKQQPESAGGAGLDGEGGPGGRCQEGEARWAKAGPLRAD